MRTGSHRGLRPVSEFQHISTSDLGLLRPIARRSYSDIGTSHDPGPSAVNVHRHRTRPRLSPPTRSMPAAYQHDPGFAGAPNLPTNFQSSSTMKVPDYPRRPGPSNLTAACALFRLPVLYPSPVAGAHLKGRHVMRTRTEFSLNKSERGNWGDRGMKSKTNLRTLA